MAALVRSYIRLRFCRAYGWGSRRLTARKMIRALGPGLLVHSRGDSQVPVASFERLVGNAPPHVETWVRDGDRHMVLRPESFLDPAADPEYAARILAFLDRHFGRQRTG